MTAPTLLLPEEYIAEATKHINRAKQSVSFLCMMMTEDLSTDGLIESLADAARRGVEVTVAADVFTFGELGGHFIPYRYYTKQSRATTSMAKTLTKAGVKFTWLGRFSTMPFTGRTHSKCLVVDDTVYSFGGVNLDGVSINNTDYMFRIKDQQLAMEINDYISRVIAADRKHFAYRSHDFSHGKNDRIMLDGGFQGDSIIYRHACRLAREASHILFVSQYCPSGKLGRILKDKDATLYFNKPSNATFWNKTIIKTNMFLSGHTTLYERDNYLHAKFMIFTMPGGNKIAITGSHNFMPGSVVFGTREIALETHDSRIIKQLESFFKHYVK